MAQVPGGHDHQPGSILGAKGRPFLESQEGHEVQSHWVLAARGALKGKMTQAPTGSPGRQGAPVSMLVRVAMLSQDRHTLRTHLP